MPERFGRVRQIKEIEEEQTKKRSLFSSSFFSLPKNLKLQQTIVAALDMPLPEDYIRRLAPPPRNSEYSAANKCVITGLPAKYKDPVTGAPYATVKAFKEIRAMAEAAAKAATMNDGTKIVSYFPL